MLRTLLAVVVSLAADASANTVNRCTIDGRTVYQAQPCPGAGRALSITAAGGSEDWVPAPAGVDLEPGKALCTQAAPARFKDPQSVRLLGVEAGKYMRVFERAGGGRVRTWAFVLSINATNSYGGYTGATDYVCFVSEDQQRVVQFRRLGVID